MCIEAVMSRMSKQMDEHDQNHFQEKKVRDRNVAYVNPVSRFADLNYQLHSLQK